MTNLPGMPAGVRIRAQETAATDRPAKAPRTGMKPQRLYGMPPTSRAKVGPGPAGSEPPSDGRGNSFGRAPARRRAAI